MALAAPTVGQPAPPFTAVDTQGKSVSLDHYKGKAVVLEWVNPGCPFVHKHYDSGNMQATQVDAQTKGVVWLAVNSTARGHADYRTPQAMTQWMQAQKAAPTDTLMDSSGQLGKAYGARTTPQLFVIDPSGTLVYAGAIDDKPSANPADIAGAKNLVKAALADVQAGKPVATPVSRPYGCSVKYSPDA
jgi:peroxiredoxin